MSTLSSPRPSIASARSTSPMSSRRPSTESTNTVVAGRTASASPSLAHRRNRAALRDYYNIRSPRPDSSFPNQGSVPMPADSTAAAPTPAVVNNELDGPNFDPEAYVSQLLADSPLPTLLRAENSLVNDIRTLDGERKALVYDNYSKLIKAVETIGKMRSSIEEQGAPMVMAKTLAPAVGFVAETATSLIREQEEAEQASKEKGAEAPNKTLDLEKETVRWVLDTPRRLKELLALDKRSEAESDWTEIDALLTKWEGVKGTKELRKECEYIMKQEEM
ncbi:hypothetical protein VTO42DRAFT_3499 [Malbranchea cinnamomea]